MNVLKIHEDDNVTIALANLPAGATVRILTGHGGPDELILINDIPFAHKVALVPIGKGAAVVKYGQTIGEATVDIVAGEHAHVDNVRSLRGRAK